MGFIWALIVGGIIAGLVGSAIGQALLGTWGPTIAGMAIIPSLIGAIILVLVVSFFARKL